MAQQLNLYGTQAPPMPGQAVLGYGPSGQHYNMQNPVYQTQGGIRPGNAAGVGGNAPASGPFAITPMRISPESQMQFANQKPHAWTALGKQQASQQQGGGMGGSGNPLLDMLGGGGNINTSITPQNIYSPQQTNEAVNQAVASSSMPLPWLQNQFAGKGMSVNSPAAISRAMVPYAQGLVQGQTAAAQIPLQDATANAQHMLAGQQAREVEGLDWARLLTSAQGLNNSSRMNTLQSVLGLLGSFA